MTNPRNLAGKNTFTQPVNQIIIMLLIVIAVGSGAYFVYPAVSKIFITSPYLNGFIIIVFIFGLFSCFWQVISLVKSVSWIEWFVEDDLEYDSKTPPALLASLAALLSDTGARYALTSTSTQTILDSIATRIEEGRELTRYIINLLIFLGLLGTFYGLATTVPAVVDTIRSLAPQENQDGMDVFNNLMSGLEQQLGGMGTAFGSSLLGLAGSLVVGVLDLFSGRGQNRFYRDLEEWLSSITKITLSSHDQDSGDSAHAGAFEQINMNMMNLQQLLTQSIGRMEQLAVSINYMVEHSNTMQERNISAFEQFVNGQTALINAVNKMQSEGEGILDSEIRMRLRNMDAHLLRILEENNEGRHQATRELRADINNLTRIIQDSLQDSQQD